MTVMLRGHDLRPLRLHIEQQCLALPALRPVSPLPWMRENMFMDLAVSGSAMQDDDQRWLDGQGARKLLDVGLHRGDRVLDFGCGTGFYTLPAAALVGPKGVVYALDRDHDKLDILAGRLRAHGLSNVELLDCYIY
ncbi:MAG: methyltransferase domain-containing protein [Thermoplasmatota archaeon]